MQRYIVKWDTISFKLILRMLVNNKILKKVFHPLLSLETR